MKIGDIAFVPAEGFEDAWSYHRSQKNDQWFYHRPIKRGYHVIIGIEPTAVRNPNKHFLAVLAPSGEVYWAYSDCMMKLS